MSRSLSNRRCWTPADGDGICGNRCSFKGLSTEDGCTGQQVKDMLETII